MLPLSQNTFSSQDIIDFLNEEMFISQIPSVLEYHQEYYVYKVSVPLITNQKYYPIPHRCIGMKLREVFLSDSNGNLYEMTRISPEDQTFFQSGNGSVNTIYSYFLEGNNLVLTSNITPVPPSNLVFGFWIRPNQLVPDDQAANIESFSNTMTFNGCLPGDTIQFAITPNGQPNPTYTTFTAVASGAGALEFNIGGTNIITATNFANSVVASGISEATNVNSTSNIVTLTYLNLNTIITTTDTANIVIPSTTVLINFDAVPSTFGNEELVDFLQRDPGHRIYTYDVPIPVNGISGNTILFNMADLVTTSIQNNTTYYFPIYLVPGDYVCLANECIIPYLPPDLHNGLAERAGARILAALGDQQGLQNSLQKIADIDKRQGNLLDNRVEGNPIKVTARHSLLSYGKMNYRRLL